MIRRFNEVQGYDIEMIPGQRRLGYAITGIKDFYDIPDFLECGGYQGSQIIFYDYSNGHTLVPLSKERDVIYGGPIFSENRYYFLRGNFNKNQLTLCAFDPDSVKTAIITELNLDDVDLYNLRLLVKTFSGETLSDEPGAVSMAEDGTWWVS